MRHLVRMVTALACAGVLAGASGSQAAVDTADSPAAQAGAALLDGRLEGAAAQGSACALVDPRCALVAARALIGLQRASEAAAALDKAAELLGPLEAHGQALLGEARLLAADAPGALAPLRRAQALDPSGPPGVRASALLADALLASGDAQGALAAAAEVASLPGLPHDVSGAMAAVRAAALARLAASGQEEVRAEAARAARALWLRFPEHPSADDARRFEAELSALPPPTGRELLQRASRLLLAGQPAASVQSAREAVAVLDGAEQAEGQLVLARALIASGQRGLAAEPAAIAWEQGARRTAPPAGMLLARDRARRGKLRPAIRLLDELARRFPTANEAPDAQLLAARLAEEAGDKAGARRRLVKLAAQRGPRAADARWTLAWLSYRAGAKGAAVGFERYAARADDAAERARGLYWAARAGSPKRKALFAQAARLDPLGYYGALALGALGRASDEAPLFPPAPKSVASEASPADDPRLLRGAELATLGLCAEAAAELERFARPARHSPAALLRALPLFARCRRFDRALTLAQGALDDAEQELRPPLLSYLYPAAYPQAVERSARRTRLDPYLLLAVARRESVFRPDARSAAGAIGLVQVLPKTAARIAAVLGRPPPDPEALADPQTALDLGAWYLADLLGAFGDPCVAAAAYNAGPRVVRKWVLAGRGRRLDEWVEEIPFRETRYYVRYVIGGWSAYRLLAGGAAPRLSATVPGPKAGVDF